MGMLAGVGAWTRRDHDAEWKEWEGWIDTISTKVGAIPGVKTEKVMPRGPSNYAPHLRISWDVNERGMTGDEAAEELLNGNPRIILSASGRGLSLMPYMCIPADDRIAPPRIT